MAGPVSHRARSVSVVNSTVCFPISPRFPRIQNEMDDQREQDHDHQVEEFSFVYHNYLPDNLKWQSVCQHGNPKRDSFRFCLRCELNELTRIASAGRMVGW